MFGDVVAAAVILPKDLILEGVNDSKKLTEKKRDALYDVIMEKALAVGIGYADAETIDRLNIKQAARLAMKRAVEALGETPDYMLVDAEKVDLNVPQLSIIKGDANSQSIAAASIIAKVTRDRLCKEEWDTLYPEYGLSIHKGYATKVHREQIMALGQPRCIDAVFSATCLESSNLCFNTGLKEGGERFEYRFHDKGVNGR